MEEKLRSFGYLIPSHLSPKADATKSKVDALTVLYDRLEATLATTDAIRPRPLGAPHYEALEPMADAVTKAAE